MYTCTGASFGYHPGGWGRPPVDEYGRPLYGDVFGAGVGIDEGQAIVDTGTLWGEVRVCVSCVSTRVSTCLYLSLCRFLTPSYTH